MMHAYQWVIFLKVFLAALLVGIGGGVIYYRYMGRWGVRKGDADTEET